MGTDANDTALKLTKQGHASVRLEKDGRTLVIDPGGYSEQEAGLGADALLVTHEHPDHFDELRLRAAMEANPEAEIWTLRSVAEQLSGAFPGRVHTVGHGDTFEAAGFEVEVHGELHAVIHPDIPQITNIGFVVDGLVFHPGDALTVPERPVKTLLLPVYAPWNKYAEVLDYVRTVSPAQVYDVHDGLLGDLGLAFFGRMLGEGGPGTGGAAHNQLRPGESVRLAR
ncbi:MBL fold metallo-hydrolase [Streptomyces qinglanensis]|uniref:L-ascorbate metabolism protein UlaG, beta-lactamase superfamily n=1 Tax=Streptomyces qinglanensis TaxID=943816 RepID=A0A1H9S3R3_9ACTN|nr:MBL fold metallo-hydrolase [Streptomyces qinglanensis]SER78769.1 L-ascorbate metabolism protein UlaG, beta-lactamase superfamily [Streptomyces qinglanensis]